MGKTPLTFIYSSPSIKAFEKLVNCMIDTFGVMANTADDIFYYGVFCDDIVYANFNWYENDDTFDFDIPEILTDDCVKIGDKITFVKNIINSVITKEIKKPEWMLYIEQEKRENRYNDSPSTFLRVIPKSAEYIDLGENLVKFLYSPNMNITWVNPYLD